MMEPIAITLWKSSGVEGICECTDLYADDHLLFLQDPGPTLRVAFKILNTFAYSGLSLLGEI